jgi:hypothetical protein
MGKELAACGLEPPAGENNAGQPAQTAEPAAAIEATAVAGETRPATEATETEAELTGQDATGKELELFTEDNRSPQLRRLTADWHTNWEKRLIEYDELLAGGPAPS